MAYTVYITRAPHSPPLPVRNRGDVIRLSEWEAVVREDESLKTVASANGEGGDNSVKLKECEVHYCSPFLPEEADGPVVCLRWENGNIACANPDETAVDKLVELAGKLSAHVQGQDGEMYISGSEPPHLMQFTLFERVPNRLRVKFPEKVPMVRAEVIHRLEPEKNRLRKMAIGFPDGTRKPSAAIVRLLNPVKSA